MIMVPAAPPQIAPVGKQKFACQRQAEPTTTAEEGYVAGEGSEQS